MIWLRRTAAFIVLIAASGAGRAVAAHAMSTSRAAVVVDLGNGHVRTARVTFSGSSVSGLVALQRAGFDPRVSSFGGIGGAICALRVDHAVMGCPTDSSCLLCAAPAYWNYFRAPKGATRYAYSPMGAGATVVHDGDVEAWKWGTGSPPARFVSFAEVWTDPPPATTTTAAPTTTSRPPPRATSTTAPAVGSQGGPTTTTSSHATTTTGTTPIATTTSASIAATTSSRPVSTTTSKPAAGVEATTTEPRAKVASGPPRVRDDSGGSNAATFAAIGIVAALIVAIVVVRARRRSGLAGSP